MSRPSSHTTSERLQDILNSNNNVIDFVQNVAQPTVKESPNMISMGHPAYIESHGIKYVPETSALHAQIEHDTHSVTSDEDEPELDDLDTRIENFLTRSGSKAAPDHHAQQIMQAQLETERHLARLQGHIEARKALESKASMSTNTSSAKNETLRLQQETEAMLKKMSLNEKVTMAKPPINLKSNLKKPAYIDRHLDDW